MPLIAGMTMSLDGYVADQQGSVKQLYPDLESLPDSETMARAIAGTGSVLMGRRAFEMGDPDDYVGKYEFQVPIFVVTHHPPEVPPKQDEHLTFTFVTDGIESAVRQAQAAAGDRDVQVIGGASVIRQLLAAGLVDELAIDVMPVILGGGLRLFDETDLSSAASLEKVEVTEFGKRTSIRFRVTPGRS